MSKITFNGLTKVISVNFGIDDLDVQSDIYSEWKRWMVTPENKLFLQAMRVVGGDPIPGRNLGSTFFLLNGWKIKPYEGDHRLVISGNLYAKDGSDVILDTVGDFKVRVMMTVSNIIDKVSVAGGGTGGSTDPVDINIENLDIISEDGWSLSVS